MTRRSTMNPRLALACAAAIGAILAASSASAQDIQYGPVAQRAIDGAKAYIAANNLENPQIHMLENSLFRNADPAFFDEWKKLTGIEVVAEPLGYTDIPSKVMGECVAKTGAFDIFNDFPYTEPDAASCGVLMPMDDFVAKGKPDYSGIPDAFVAQQRYNGKQYSMVLDGDHIMLVLRKDIVENPQARAEFKAATGKDLGRSRRSSSTPRLAKPAGASPSTSRCMAPWPIAQSTSRTATSRPISAAFCSTRT
jgi:ABC-type glycerol-3-phosphate transport system substrate-binding protein